MAGTLKPQRYFSRLLHAIPTMTIFFISYDFHADLTQPEEEKQQNGYMSSLNAALISALFTVQYKSAARR